MLFKASTPSLPGSIMIGIDAHAVIFIKHVDEMISFHVSCNV
jgi:hypothetical protein